VADEVRTLANRTHQSTQDIKAMTDSLRSGMELAVKDMQEGREHMQVLVDESVGLKRNLDAAFESVTKVVDMNAQVATATEEQNSVVDAMSRNVTAINDHALGTVDGANSAIKSSNEMEEVARQLESLVRQVSV